MRRIPFVVAIAAAFTIFGTAANAANFQARDKGANTQATVFCPPGTCSRIGTDKAYSLSYCSAANCKKKK
jgi:hypothetical protein